MARRDRRLKENRSGKRRVVVVTRERKGQTVTSVYQSEEQAVPEINARVELGSVHADEASAWNKLHARYDNHSQSYSDGIACTDQAESSSLACAARKSERIITLGEAISAHTPVKWRGAKIIAATRTATNSQTRFARCKERCLSQWLERLLAACGEMSHLDSIYTKLEPLLPTDPSEGRMPDATYNLNGGFKPTIKRSADLDGPDFFPTPRWATFALIDNEKFTGDIWECACGDGSMSKVLAETGNEVRSSDLYQRGFGEAGHDFLHATRTASNIITNPPYNAAEGFVAQGLKLADKKFALLLRLAFLEGANRANTIFSQNPPARVWVFSERITFYMKGAEQGGSGTTAYAWFVWDTAAQGETQLRWFKPGYKARFRAS